MEVTGRPVGPVAVCRVEFVGRPFPGADAAFGERGHQEVGGRLPVAVGDPRDGVVDYLTGLAAGSVAGEEVVPEPPRALAPRTSAGRRRA